MTHKSRLTAKPRCTGNMGGWQERHMNAVRTPTKAATRVMVGMIGAWLEYADTHKAKYGSGIGDDGVLGDYWAQMGVALLGMLNGDCGSLDCGTLDGVILDAMKAEGFDPDTM